MLDSISQYLTVSTVAQFAIRDTSQRELGERNRERERERGGEKLESKERGREWEGGGTELESNTNRYTLVISR